MEQKRNTAGTAPAIDALLEGLNPAQRSAVAFGLGAERGPVPPLLIAAGAGTGKTKTLAHRVARLILEGVDPRRLLLLTFTRRAALEMTRRAQQILAVSRRGRAVAGTEAALLPWSGTFIRSAIACCAGTPPPSRWIPPSLCLIVPTAPI
jgi:DNA helicase-2/ATP-dependent DNA helicase PcrA